MLPPSAGVLRVRKKDGSEDRLDVGLAFCLPGPGSVPLEIGLLARMRVGESGDRHAGVVDAHHSLEGLEVGVE